MKRPCSMTSFGRGQSGSEQKRWTVEIRTVNHRYLDLKIKLPPKYMALEDRIKKEICRSIGRGHVNVTLSLSGIGTETSRLTVNLPLADEYHRCLAELKTHLQIDEPTSVSQLLSLKDLIIPVDEDEDLDAIWEEIKPALTASIESSERMREQEGQTLKEDLLARLNEFSMTVEAIEAAIPAALKTKEENLKQRLEKLLADLTLDPQRLAQEVAIIADKSDITEEIVRLKSHIQQFSSSLSQQEPIGRRLDFLLQEFLREINTMASKIADVTIVHQTVTLKNEAEKMREQVQNLE